MTSASRLQWGGADILGFLRTFEGAAATFSQGGGLWSLWLPEFSADGHPLTPASQIFFPVILRHGEQAYAIRFFYDCATGKVRYYTSAIPEEIARLPQLENAISELFRHSLPVEAIRQRSLGRKNRRAAGEPPLEPRPVHRQSLADPDDRSVPAAFLARPAESPESPSKKLPSAPAVSVTPALPPAAEATVKTEPMPVVSVATVASVAPPRPVTTLAPRPLAPARELVEISPSAAPPSEPRPPREVTRTVRLEIGPRVRSVLVAVILVIGAAALAAIGAYVYLQVTQDPGVEHHRLQLEEMRLRNGG